MNARLTSLPPGLLLAAAAPQSLPAIAQSADSGWPRVFKKNGQQLTVYHPQVDYWNHYSSSGSWSQNKSSMESQAQSLSWGNQQHQSARSWRSGSHNLGGGSGGFSRGGGGGGRRR